MAEFLTTSGISSKIEEIIKNADEHLFFVSPYLKLSRIIRENMFDAIRRNVSLYFVYGKKDLDKDEFRLLFDFSFEGNMIELRYLDNLHAKVYLNEKQMIVTSMNLHEFSEKNNREIGIYIDSNHDNDLFNSIYEEVWSIYNASKKITHGCCIFCRKFIKYNTLACVCKECIDMKYDVGEGRFCHKCGKPYPTVKSKPLCFYCSSKL
ncbi:MAG: phospholipase D family protein [Prevotellaceae bacterium]|jgi:phosphatidylserine/phosphatidylglycerophosphate/cardiolipin synthase-like enzyme|nr:phospholipase D family protein [Prevotellaceae bacterium]